MRHAVLDRLESRRLLAAATFTIDPAASTLVMTATLGTASNPVTMSPQSAGSDRTRFTGAINTDLTSNSIRFTGASLADATALLGTYQPAGAAADYAMKGQLAFLSVATALRDFRLDVSSASLSLSGTSFPSSSVTHRVTAGRYDFEHNLRAGGFALAGRTAANAAAPAGSLSTSGTTQTLTLPVRFTLRVDSIDFNGSFTLSGNLVARRTTTTPPPPPPGGASIAGRVWNDTDRDRTIDANESGLSGRTVYLDADNDSTLDANETRVLSDSSGNYRFTNLPAGTYKIRQVLPSGWTQTNPSNNFGHNATLATNGSTSNLNFGAVGNGTTPPPVTGATITGRVWNDADRDRTIDANESGLSGRTVYLDADNDSTLDANETRVLSDSAGNYRFTNLAAGTYKIRQVLPSGWTQTNPSNNFGHNATLATNGSASNLNFGAVGNGTTPPPVTGASIAGRVWNDADRDRVIDSNELGIAGRVIYLDTNNNGTLDASETRVTTDAAGNYRFTNLAAGTYKIRQVLPSGWLQTTPTNNFGHNATLATNGTAGNLNFGTVRI